jgi:hypothetical protein
MVQFPTFESLAIKGYLLYPGHEVDSEEALQPGSSERDCFELDFSPGPWVVLGVNGLGKSTLLLLLKHMLIGPVRAREAGFTGERADIVSIDPRFFAVRVQDNARSATGSLRLRIGESTLAISRRLNDQSFLEATVEFQTNKRTITVESDWRDELTKQMGLTRFEDTVRVLDRLVFYLEDRATLIWDVSAQFELFRAALTPEHSRELRQLEAEIVSNDSAARNLNATIYKLSQRRDRQLRLIETSADTHAQIATATADRDKYRAEELRLQGRLDAVQPRRTDARTHLKRCERDVDLAASSYEEIKYRLLRHAFAGISPNEQYVFLKIISDRICLACGNQAQAMAEELEARRAEGRCLVCGTARKIDKDVISTAEALTQRAAEAYSSLEKARIELASAKQRQADVETEFSGITDALESARQAVDSQEALLRKLHRKLPASDRAALSREEDRLEGLRREVIRFRDDRDHAEEEISGLLEQLRDAAVLIRTKLESSFFRLAKRFFAEQVRLVYAPRRDRIGQSGRLFDFPAFEVEMTSGATRGEFVRRTREQVSLSQREYLDIIFRMSLLEVLGDGSSSLVVDGPETSLDAVFAARAGDLFARFSALNNSNAILACNIVEGAFLPNTLQNYPNASSRRSRTVDLLDNAAPTAALQELRPAYRTAIEEILQAEPKSL